MSFKWGEALKQSIFILILLLSLSGLLGCQNFLNDKPEQPKVLQADMESKKCLSKVTDVFANYFQQKFAKSEWDASWECIDQSVVEFMQVTHGEKESLYEASELNRFFKKLFSYVFKKEISDDLVNEILKLKQSLIGGESDTLTRAELEKLRSFFRLLSKQMESLNPHLGVLLFRDELDVRIDADKDKIEKAIAALKSSISAILKNSNFSQSTYSLPEVKLLLDEVDKISGNSDPDSAFAKWRNKLPFLNRLRTIFIGSTIDVKDSAEVEKIWMLVVDAFRSGVYLVKGINKVEFSNPNDFKVVDEWVEGNFIILLNTFQWKKKQEILYDDLDYLIEELSKEDFWPKKLSATTFQISYRRFVSRVLDDYRDDKLTALSFDHIVQLRREYRSYQLIQKQILENIFNKESSLTPDAVRIKLNSLRIQPKVRSMARFSLGEEKFYSKAWEQFLKIVNSKAYTRHWNSDGQMIIVPNDSKIIWNYQDLWTINIYRWGVQALMRGFAEDPKDAQSQTHLTKEELKAIYTEFELFCVEMGIFDSRNSETSARSQKEADLFTPSGNGDGLLQFEEMFDLFAMMYSGGMVAVNRVYKFAQTENKLLADIDYFNNQYIEFGSFNDILQNKFADIFTNLPYFVDYVKTLDAKAWQKFYNSMIRVSRICPNNTIGIETADQRTFTTVVNYIEDIFNIFDINRNQILDEDEVETAFDDRFSNFIIDVTKKRVQTSHPIIYSMIPKNYDWNSLGLEVFKFMIVNGRAPVDFELLAFIKDDYFNNVLYVDADRAQIATIFATLKAEISKNAPKCAVF